MAKTGFFDAEVGIRYSGSQSKIKNKDMWFTDDQFSFYIGEIKDQKFVTVPQGFLTDGASVPRFLWWIFPPWGAYGQAAVTHDFLCQNLRLNKNGDNPVLTMTQEEVDKTFLLAMKVLGTPWWKRKVMYWAVRIYHTL